MKLGWIIFNVIAIVVVSTFANLSIQTGTIVVSISALRPIFIANAAGIYIFSFLLGVLGLLYKKNKKLGFVLASWVGLFFMIYVISEVWRG